MTSITSQAARCLFGRPLAATIRPSEIGGQESDIHSLSSAVRGIARTHYGRTIFFEPFLFHFFFHDTLICSLLLYRP